MFFHCRRFRLQATRRHVVGALPAVKRERVELHKVSDAASTRDQQRDADRNALREQQDKHITAARIDTVEHRCEIVIEIVINAHPSLQVAPIVVLPRAPHAASLVHVPSSAWLGKHVT